MNFKALTVAPCVAMVLAIGSAHADTINGTVYTGQNPFVSSNIVLAAPNTSKPSSTFTVSAPGNINLFASTGLGNYTIGGFLASNGGTVSGLSSSIGTMNLDNTIFDFTGSTNLVNGQTYSVQHDDGMYLFIDSTYSGNIQQNPSNSNNAANANNKLGHPGEVIIAGKPVPPTVDSFVFTGTTGVHSFDLLYTEVNGSPGTLDLTALGSAAQTPEPGTFVLMGTGLMSIAGMVRRRMRS